MPEMQINEFLAASDMTVLRRLENSNLWEATFARLPYKPVAYSNVSLDYQLAYQCGHGGDWQDMSFIIYWDNRPVALWPLSISTKDGESKLTSQGLPVLPPLFVPDCPSVSRKRIIKSCQDFANSVTIGRGISSWESSESFSNSVGMSDWHIEAMGRDAICNLRHELYLDLRPDMVEIKATFRKSYKSLVSTGTRMWAVGVLDSGGDEKTWEEFRDLHIKVSGRVTRSAETWALQYRDVERQNAFLVWLRNAAGDMVGGGLFSYTCDEGLYAVGAYDRALFDKPLGHVVQYRAIEELKKKGVVWYKLGERFYGSDMPRPSDKEISIGKFKQGFASHFFPCYRLTHKANTE